MKQRHADEVAKGLHDNGCEYGPRLLRNPFGDLRPTHLHMCHCAKRRRIAAGHTEPPGPLIVQYPLCPRCYREVSHDGDGFVCKTCATSWDDDDPDDEGTFIDEYGDLGEPVNQQVSAGGGS